MAHFPNHTLQRTKWRDITWTRLSPCHIKPDVQDNQNSSLHVSQSLQYANMHWRSWKDIKCFSFHSGSPQSRTIIKWKRGLLTCCPGQGDASTLESLTSPRATANEALFPIHFTPVTFFSKGHPSMSNKIFSSTWWTEHVFRWKKMECLILFFIFKKIFIYFWLRQVLVVIHGIFIAACKIFRCGLWAQ